MDITSFAFYIFIAIFLALYWCMPKNVQWCFLLAGSAFFVLSGMAAYTCIYIIASVFSVWGATTLFQKVDSGNMGGYWQKRRILAVTLCLNIGILAVLKYTNLGIHTINVFIKATGHGNYLIPDVNFLAPLAISFYTLQIVSYLCDCYWGLIEPEKNPFRLMLFTIYFPQMVCGPISRYSEIGGQLFAAHPFDYEKTVHGLRRVGLGLIKKLAVSNRLAIIVNHMWEHTEVYNGMFVWLAMAGFALQLYTDFSGCMDIVLGYSECMGIQLPENFKAPFFSRTVREFWQRWHITLGAWLRDYIMNPLLKSKWLILVGEKSIACFGKKKGRKIPVYLAMFFLWTAMGLWHGDSWKYAIGEGWWFWLVIVSGQIFSEVLKKIKTALHVRDDSRLFQVVQVARTDAIYLVGMVFFRAASLRDGFERILLSFSGTSKTDLLRGLFGIKVIVGNRGWLDLIIFLLAICMLLISEAFTCCGKDLFSVLGKKHFAVRWCVYTAALLVILVSYGVNGQQFAYARF